MPVPGAGLTTLYGTVTDRSGRPIPGATIELVRWSDTGGGGGGGVWLRDPRPAARAMTDTAGHYAVTAPYGSYRIEAHAGAGVAIGLGYRADRATRRLDIAIDPSIPSTFDAALLDPALDCEWICPRDHAPREEWWLPPNPCPEGSTVTVTVDAANAASSIACTAKHGEGHGPFTTWEPTTAGWVRRSGWRSHGDACGEWIDPEPLRP
jgi:hypothetical protein